jgi:hypothetical protein
MISQPQEGDTALIMATMTSYDHVWSSIVHRTVNYEGCIDALLKAGADRSIKNKKDKAAYQCGYKLNYELQQRLRPNKYKERWRIIRVVIRVFINLRWRGQPQSPSGDLMAL